MFTPEVLKEIVDDVQDFAEKLLVKDKFLDPVALFFYSEDFMIPIPIDLQNKEKSFKIIQSKILEAKPKAVIIVVEAWTMAFDNNDKKDMEEIKRVMHSGLSSLENKQECIMLTVGSLYGVNVQNRIFERNDDGSIEFKSEVSSYKVDGESSFFRNVWDRLFETMDGKAM